MSRLHRLCRVALMIAAGVLVLGLGAYAQDFELFPTGLEQPVADDALWEKLQAVREALDESAVAATSDVTGLALEVSTLLLGDDLEPGLISLVQELAGVEDSQLIDAQAVVEANIDPPELIALAHLILASQAIRDAADINALLDASTHVAEAERLLSHLKPAEDAVE